jgi:hypothetical protein
MWERTLQDLIRGLRANKNDERKFVSQAIDEIRQEVRSKDMELKAGAILKMTFVCTTSSHYFDTITDIFGLIAPIATRASWICSATTLHGQIFILSRL